MGKREEIVASLGRNGKGTWEIIFPWVTNLASIASIVGLIIAIVWQKPWPWGFIVVAMSLIIAQASLLWIFVNTLRQRDREHAIAQMAVDGYEDLEKQIVLLKTQLSQDQKNKVLIAHIFHNFCHQYRHVITEVFSDEPFPGEKTDHYRTLREFFRYMLSQIKEVFDVLTGDSCAACVKILDENNISTLVRDDISSRRRSAIDMEPDYHEFDYRLNVAFAKIMSGTNPARYFASNDLTHAENYHNCNPEWRSLYNATLVVPIRYVQEKTGKSWILGFICIDNFKGGLENRMAVDILASFADLSFHLCHLISETVDGDNEES